MACVEAVELADEIVETSVGGGQLAQDEPGQPRGARRPEQKAEMADIGTADEGRDDLFEHVHEASFPKARRP